MPAEELEQKIAYVVQQHLKAPRFTGQVLQDASASEIATAKAKVQLICARKDIKPTLDLIDRINLTAGKLSVSIQLCALENLLEHDFG